MFPRRFPDNYSDEEGGFLNYFFCQPHVFKLTFICVPQYT